jgi:hypothetical protein
MPKPKVPPSVKISNEIFRLVYALSEPQSDPREIAGRLIQQLMLKTMQEILENEVSEFIGKGYYEQGPERT